MQNRVTLPSTITLSEPKEDGLFRVHINGYSGAPVSLWDYGVDDPVVYNIAGIKTDNVIPYLLDHSPRQILGHTESIEKTDKNLSADAVHSHPGTLSKETAEAIKNKVPYQASMGLDINPETVTYIPKDVKATVNGRDFVGPLFIVNDSELVELSATLFGRDKNTSVSNSFIKDNMMRIRNATISPPENEGPDDDGQGTGTTVTNNDPTPKPPVKDAKTEEKPPVKVDNMDWLFDYLEYPQLVKNARKENWSQDRMEREVQILNKEESFPGIPDVYIPNRKVENAFEARVALATGMKPETVEKFYGEKAADYANSAKRIGMKEMLMMVANAEGGHFNGHSDVNNMCRFIKKRVINQAFSTIDFPNLMNRISDYRLEEAWMMDEPWSISRCKKVSNNNFQPTGHIRPSGGTMWEGFDDEGKLRHGKVGLENTYTTQLSTVGQILTFKREDIENDNIGWIEETLNFMLEGARMVPDWQLVQRIYGGKGTHTVDGVNQFALPLTAENLETVYNAVKRIQLRKNGNEKPTARVKTKWVLVIADSLEKIAWEILNQLQFVSNTNSNVLQGRDNFWYQKFEVSIFDQLDNDTYYDGVDDAAWGLWPVRDTYAPYAMSFLRGQERPTTEVVDMPADMLGFGVRGWYDVNVDFSESQMVAWSFPGDDTSAS